MAVNEGRTLLRRVVAASIIGTTIEWYDQRPDGFGGARHGGLELEAIP